MAEIPSTVVDKAAWVDRRRGKAASGFTSPWEQHTAARVRPLSDRGNAPSHGTIPSKARAAHHLFAGGVLLPGLDRLAAELEQRRAQGEDR